MHRLLDETARAAIAEALRQANGDRLEAARRLEIEPDDLLARARELDLVAHHLQVDV